MKRRTDEEISAPLYQYDAAIRAEYGCFAGEMCIRDSWWCERAFMPWLDMKAEMERLSLPLYTLESKDPLACLLYTSFCCDTQEAESMNRSLADTLVLCDLDSLLLGPSGVGKTLLAQTLAKICLLYTSAPAGGRPGGGC